MERGRVLDVPFFPSRKWQNFLETNLVELGGQVVLLVSNFGSLLTGSDPVHG